MLLRLLSRPGACRACRPRSMLNKCTATNPCHRALEGEFIAGEAGSRWRVLALVAAFDCVMFVLRAASKVASGSALGLTLLTQLCNMALLYTLTALLNARSRRQGSRAAHQVSAEYRHGAPGEAVPPAAATRLCAVGHAVPLSSACLIWLHAAFLQEEVLLSGLVASAISLLVLSLRPQNVTDYVYAALFLTCTSSILKLRWLSGTLALTAPVAVAAVTNLRLRWPGAGAAMGAACVASNGLGGDASAGACSAASASIGLLPQLVTVGPLPPEALVHILVAWAVGALMAYVSGEAMGSPALCLADFLLPALPSRADGCWCGPAGRAAPLLLWRRKSAGAAHQMLCRRPPADSNRRQTFVSHKLALDAAGKELEEVQASAGGASCQRQPRSLARALCTAAHRAPACRSCPPKCVLSAPWACLPGTCRRAC